uniref:G-patch domain-containing protein n=1 Tax=Fagus sylvatica TaxID=28930 RepID=A0A2N9HXL0_FAGSY
MAGETSGPGPSEQEIRMVALERKFDELLSFVQLIAKRNTEDENQRKEDDKDTSEGRTGGTFQHQRLTPPRPPTPPKPEGKDSQLGQKIDSLEEKIRLIQGLNSFRKHGLLEHVLENSPSLDGATQDLQDPGVSKKYNGRGDPMIHLQMYCRKMAPYADNEPLLIQTMGATFKILPAPRAPKESTEAGTCQYHPGAETTTYKDAKSSRRKYLLITIGIDKKEGRTPRDCMTIDQLRLSPYEKTNFQARMERIEEDFEKFCERKKEELGKLTPATPLEMSGPDPVVIRYVTKEKVVLQTASVSAVQSSEKVPSVVIQVPQPFPYQDSKKIPWNYGMKVISTRESQPKTKEEVVGNLTSGLGGITRSGRCYTPEELEKRRKEAGKAVEDPTKTKAAEEEAADFLRIIKSSEYSIVKQLSKMPSHISVLSLLLASESHRKALLKVLNEAYVPEDITGPSFENMVTSILVTNQLTFSDDELPPEGRGHTKALYISVKTNDRVVSRVLIDNGSALNVCPLSTLEKLDIDPTRVRVNSMVVRAFDGTRREVLGEIDLPVEIGPQVYDINFQVLRIDSPYNLLLGRPWLHTAGAVPSSLHQKMKLIIGNQLVTILAEEPISIYNDGEIPYIDGCAPEEASFHSFEFVTVIHRVAAVEPRLSKAGIMVAKEFVKAGFQPGQGLGYANQGRTTIVTLEGNKDKYGLGYTPTRRDRQMAYEARRQRAAAKLKGEKWPERRIAIPHIRTTFPASAMFQVDEGDVDELALLFTEDLNVNAITTEGDSAAFPVHADQHEEIDLEDFLDEENLKGYRIDEETLDEDTWEDDDLPDLLPHLMVPRGLDTLELEIFCEHGDPESHLRN